MLSKGYILDEKYEVIKVLGKGGMATVYLCKNTRLDNLWAIKETKKDDKIDTDITTEPNILKKLNYPGIPKIIDIFYENNNFYLVEEYIEGQTLKEYVKENRYLEVENICQIISSICDIIKYLHSFNPPIIYRDVKPSNIMITPTGKVVLIDFGISKIYKVGNDGDTVNLGSIGYAAPEQSGSEQSCRQTDIYGIGMVMYFMTTGKVSATAAEPLIDGNYADNTNVDLKKIIQKCVQSEIKDRYTSIEELNDEIVELLNKYREDKTLLLNSSNIKQDQKITNFKARLSLIGMIVIVAIIFVIIYFLYNNNKGYNDIKAANKPAVETTIPTTIPTTKSITPTVSEVIQPTITPANNGNTNSSPIVQYPAKGKSTGKRNK